MRFSRQKEFVVKFEDKYYLMSSDAAYLFFHELRSLYDNTDVKHAFRTGITIHPYRKKVEGYVKLLKSKGDITELPEDEIGDRRVRNFHSSWDQIVMNLKRGVSFKEVLIGIGGGLFFGSLFTGDLFFILLCAFGAFSMIFSGVVLGRDLEKDYNY